MDRLAYLPMTHPEFGVLDEHRARLEHLIAEAEIRLETAPNSEFVSELINDLLGNLLAHFEREEQILGAQDKSRLDMQRSAHTVLLEEMMEICFSVLQGDKRAVCQLRAFLNGALLRHLRSPRASLS